MTWLIVAILGVWLLPEMLPATDYAAGRPTAIKSRIHTQPKWRHFAPG
jgi:hypothetical protein